MVFNCDGHLESLQESYLNFNFRNFLGNYRFFLFDKFSYSMQRLQIAQDALGIIVFMQPSIKGWF